MLGIPGLLLPPAHGLVPLDLHDLQVRVDSSKQLEAMVFEHSAEALTTSFWVHPQGLKDTTMPLEEEVGEAQDGLSRTTKYKWNRYTVYSYVLKAYMTQERSGYGNPTESLLIDPPPPSKAHLPHSQPPEVAKGRGVCGSV